MTSLFRKSSTVVSPTPDQPGHSILLNGSQKSPAIPQTQHIEDAGSLHTQSSSSSPHGSNSNLSLSSSSNPTRPSLPGQASSQTSSSKVSFAPLPTVPLEMKRRNTITLGVAARKDMLVQQGTAPRAPTGAPRPTGGAGGGGGERGSGSVRKVYMTDEEWEEYKRKYDEKNGANAVDLGELASKGAKNLWRKVRSSSSSSNTSNSSSTSAQSSNPSNSTSDPSGSSLASPRTFFRTRKRDASPASISSSLTSGPDELETVFEEDRSPLDMSSLHGALGLHNDDGNLESWTAPYTMRKDALGVVQDGDATPRRVGSPPPARRPSPPPRPGSDLFEEDDEFDEGDEEPEREINTAPPTGYSAAMPSIQRTSSERGATAGRNGSSSAILGFDSAAHARS